jgi:hypothetical protein
MLSFSFFRTYCDWARLSLSDVARKQHRSITCCLTSFVELERNHVKKFHINICFVQRDVVVWASSNGLLISDDLSLLCVLVATAPVPP